MSLKKAMITAFAWCLITANGQAQDDSGLVLVPEMQRPPGILYQRASIRRDLKNLTESGSGLEVFQKRIRDSWPAIQALDWVALSRRHIEQTRAYRLPDLPILFEPQIIGRDETTGKVYLELRGPRLPARFEIVHRYAYFYSSFDPATQSLGPVIVTIRGWILE